MATLIRLRHKLKGAPAYARNSNQIRHRHACRKPRHCWLSATCDLVVLAWPPAERFGASVDPRVTHRAPRADQCWRVTRGSHSSIHLDGWATLTHPTQCRRYSTFPGLRMPLGSSMRLKLRMRSNA